MAPRGAGPSSGTARTLGGLSAAQFLSGAPSDVSVIGNAIQTPYSRRSPPSVEYLSVAGRSEFLLVDRNAPVPPAFVRPNTAFRPHPDV